MKNFESLKEFEMKTTLEENKTVRGGGAPGSYGQLATYVDGVFWGYDGEEYSVDLKGNYWWW